VSVTEPSATEVTKPAEEIAATLVSDELHVAVAPDTTFPFASLIVVLNVVVSPIDPKLSELADNSIVAAP
jgi:hypothetical protein